MAVRSTKVQPMTLAAFGKFDSLTVGVTLQVNERADALVAQSSYARRNDKQIFVLNRFKTFANISAYLQDAENIPQACRILLEDAPHLFPDYTAASLDALVRRLVEQKFLDIRDSKEYGPNEGVPFIRITGTGMAYLVNHKEAQLNELKNFIITGSPRGLTDIQHSLPENAYVTDWELMGETDYYQDVMSCELFRKPKASEQQGYHLQYDVDASVELMRAVVARDHVAAWQHIGDKFAFATLWVQRFTDNKKMAAAFLKGVVYPQITDIEVMETLAEAAEEHFETEEEASAALVEEILRVAWLTLRTATDVQTGIHSKLIDHMEMKQGQTEYLEMRLDEAVENALTLADDRLTRDDITVTFEDGSAIGVEIKGKAGTVPQDMAIRAQWVQEALQAYQDPDSFYYEMQEEMAADWAAQQMMDQARGK
jgi:hypothetical protein